MKTPHRRAALFAAVLLLASVASAYDPVNTRYDTSQYGKRAITFALGSATDTTFAPGFLIYRAGVTIFSGQCIVQPIFDTSRKIGDQGSIFGRSIANPRAGSALMYWDPDSLFAGTSRNRWSFCCGDAQAIRVKSLGVLTTVRIWMSGR